MDLLLARLYLADATLAGSRINGGDFVTTADHDETKQRKGIEGEAYFLFSRLQRVVDSPFVVRAIDKSKRYFRALHHVIFMHLYKNA